MKLRLLGWELSRSPRRPPPLSSPAAPQDPFSPLDIIQHLAEGVMAVARDRRIVLANESLAPLLRLPPAKAVGLPFWEAVRHREANDMLEAALAGKVPAPREITLPVPVETVWRVDARPLAAGAVLSFVDLTQLKRLETIRKDFVANVSHELKTPLTSLRAALETLLDGALEDPVHAREFMETAQTQVDRLQRLIEDLLALSRLERPGDEPRPARASLGEAARRCLAALRPLADKTGVSFEADLPPEPLWLALPEDELSQVLLNLLDNAVKFNRPGGRVSLGAAVRDGGAELRVADTGVGIPPEDQPRLFERFYRVDKARSRDVGGTGLGLSIVKHIVENRKGSIRLESAPGRGSTFTVSLPLAD